MWISIVVPLFFVSGIIADVSHLTHTPEFKDEKIPVPLLTNELPVPSVEPLEVPKDNDVQEEVTTILSVDVPSEPEPTPVQEPVPGKTHLPILLVSRGSGRSLNLGEVDPGFSRPVTFPFGRSLNLADPVFLPYLQQYQFRHVVLDNEYLPPAQQTLVLNNELQNEYLPPDNDYLPPQARNKPPKQSESDKLKEEVVTEVPVVVETTEEVKEVEAVTEVKPAEYREDVEASDSVIVTKQGTSGQDEVVVVHKQQVPEKIEIIPSSGYFYPRPRVLFLYKK